jgi:hypothetical protein
VEILDELVWRGRRWIVRGFTRLGMAEAETWLSLQDAKTGEWVSVSVTEIEPSRIGPASAAPTDDTDSD